MWLLTPAVNPIKKEAIHKDGDPLVLLETHNLAHQTPTQVQVLHSPVVLASNNCIDLIGTKSSRVRYRC